MIDTRFWSDTYISDIDPLEKLLFLYFLTNPFANICGIYEIPIKQISLDTGIDKNNIEKVFLPRLKKARKIFYTDGWVYVKNFIKHQSSSPKIIEGIENGKSLVPSHILKKLYGMDRVCIPSAVFESESESESESEQEQEAKTHTLSPSEVSFRFFEEIQKNQDNPSGLSETTKETLNQFKSRNNLSKNILWKEVKKFTDYWTEKNKTGRKERWELEKTFEVKKRLSTWLGKEWRTT